MESKELALTIAKVLYDKKASNIDVLYVGNRTVITDYLVIASGRTYNQVRSLMHEVEEQLEKKDIFATRKEGASEGRWCVIDYNYVMVHIFYKKDRDYYKLDSLWADKDNWIDLGFESDDNN